MALVEPVPDAPAAVADCGGERALVVADYHAGIEAGLRYERGVELRSDADGRRDRLLALRDRIDPDRVVVLGDLIHRIEVADAGGLRRGDVGFVHGHTWPDRSVLGAATVCIGHEHPQVRLEDEVGGGRTEKAWLRGRLRVDPFADHFGVDPAVLAWGDPELVVFPAFNDRSGGTWINVEGQSFLSPFLPEALIDGEAYLLDGTRLGAYRRV